MPVTALDLTSLVVHQDSGIDEVASHTVVPVDKLVAAVMNEMGPGDVNENARAAAQNEPAAALMVVQQKAAVAHIVEMEAVQQA